VFITLYAALLVVDIWLMRRYAGLDPQPPEQRPPAPQPVPSL